MNKLLYTYFIFILFNNFLFSQNDLQNSLNGGINIYASTNKLTTGINLMYVNKKSVFFYFNGNIGLTGYKKFDDLIYEKTDSFQLGNTNTYSYAYNIKNYYSTPYNENNTIRLPVDSMANLKNYHAKIKGYFINLSVGIPVNRKKTFYAGLNTLYFWNTDNGTYSYTTNSFKGKVKTQQINASFQTYGLGFLIAYMLQLNDRISILSKLNFNFYFPITNSEYGVGDGSNPLVGNEQDMSISLNYKF